MHETDRPIVAICPQWEDDIAALSCRERYITFLQKAGAAAFILTYDMTTHPAGQEEQLLALCDGVLFPGGADIHPFTYGADYDGAKGPFQPVRDQMEIRILKRALQLDIPVLSICRGLQLVNVALGGTLVQDIQAAGVSNFNHWQKKPYSVASHSVNVLPNTPLAEIVGCSTLEVNSMHHQSCNGLAPGLELAAISEDGVIESAYVPNKEFVLAVQWHPEYMLDDPASRKLANAFVSACEKYRESNANRC